MYKLDLPVDYKEAAAIERRRNMESQRKSRIFNAKTRIIGVDLDAIDQQKKDKQQMEEYERRRHEAFAHDLIRADQIAELLEKRQQHDVSQLNMALNEFRALHQQPNSRREWDLYDPDYLKKDKPARVHDDDPRCGISSMQKFDGEDLNQKARSKFMGEQHREWAEQQAREKEAARMRQKEADRLYELKMRELDERAMDLQRAEEQCRKAMDCAQADYNNALARENAEKQRLHKQQQEDDNATEIANHVFGDILTENPAVAQSAFGAHRVITDRWKGMNPQQLEDIKQTQLNQMKENARLKQEEALRDKEWEDQRIAHARAALLLEREKERAARELNKQFVDDNQRLGAEQESHKEFLDKEVYTNPPTAAYFMQFNTTTR
ncbi:RIB43A-like with coiled-coils protein 2 [Lineus longissimus]|uniref:RIB43A-like with coiled-coils protein 2 n=1 Tax=Lineus longissimus TaxID=88925 RepID=UPI002B4F13C6